MTDTIDDFALDPSRIASATEAINAALASAKAPPPDTTYEAGDLPSASTLGELLEQYDYGEPLWNGSLMLVAKHCAIAEPTTVEVSALDELPAVESEYISHFHHGDVVVPADFGAFDSVWITGSLTVEGVIEASFLDTFQDLMVGGDVRCRAISMMGLSFIAGELAAERFAWVQSQGENWVLGGVSGGWLIGEYESTEGWDVGAAKGAIDLQEAADDKAALAEKLGVTLEPDDEHAHDVVFRALEAAGAG
ncbi:MAG: hypothetical protein JJ863_22370 [Deltaproteobacteria bacterium]|nr:hypothetical protein [Deltaproteobacteria bacterium]